MKLRASVLACVLLFAPAAAMARVTQISVRSVEPFAPGTSFGSAGGYERVRGTFKGEVDPQDARNRVIVNLDKAPTNAQGLVEFSAPFSILSPSQTYVIPLFEEPQVYGAATYVQGVAYESVGRPTFSGVWLQDH